MVNSALVRLREYCKLEESFTSNNFAFDVTPDNMCVVAEYTGYRLVCWSMRKSNANGTNGQRLEWRNASKFFAKIVEGDLVKVAAILTQKSKKEGVKFTLDDELTENDGQGVLLFYRIEELTSPVIV